jgi:hypothetical protein
MKTSEWEELLAADPLSIRLSRIEDPAVPPRLMEKVLTGRPIPTTRRSRRMRKAVVVGGLALALIVVATPAIARSILPPGLQQRLGLVVGAPAVITRPPNAQPGIRVTPNLSLADAQAKVSFTIPTPGWLPDGVSFKGALVEPNDSGVYLAYRGAGGGGVGLAVHPGTKVGGPAVPAAQRVQVDGSPAYFVHGSYESSGPGTAATWDPAADDEELTWQRNGITYDLTAGGLHLSRTDLVRIAESIR